MAPYKFSFFFKFEVFNKMGAPDFISKAATRLQILLSVRRGLVLYIA
jgi:hypothetical protein